MVQASVPQGAALPGWIDTELARADVTHVELGQRTAPRRGKPGRASLERQITPRTMHRCPELLTAGCLRVFAPGNRVMPGVFTRPDHPAGQCRHTGRRARPGTARTLSTPGHTSNSDHSRTVVRSTFRTVRHARCTNPPRAPRVGPAHATPPAALPSTPAWRVERPDTTDPGTTSDRPAVTARNVRFGIDHISPGCPVPATRSPTCTMQPLVRMRDVANRRSRWTGTQCPENGTGSLETVSQPAGSSPAHRPPTVRMLTNR